MQNFQQRTAVHMTRPHHSDIVYREINPINLRLVEIDTSSTPVSKYKSLVSDVFKDQLREGMNETMAKKIENEMETEAMRREYNKMCENNAMLQLSNMQRRKQYYNAIQDQQNRREQFFVDGFRDKNIKIQKHISSTGKDNLFFKLQQQYDVFMKHNQDSYKNTLTQQLEQKQHSNQLRKQQKQNQIQHRKRIQQYLSHLNSQQKQQQLQNKMIYKQELDKLVEVKQPRQNSKPMVIPHQRHNPITNPIDHHIDNPYIMRKIMQRMNL